MCPNCQETNKRRFYRANALGEYSEFCIQCSPVKWCAHCESWKPKSDFYGNNSKHDFLSSWCKDCSDQEYLRKQHERIEQEPKYQRAIDDGDTLRCNYCLEFKPKTEFHTNPTTRTGYSTKCKQCHKEQYR